MDSVWQKEKLPRFPKLDGDLHTDVLILGGGIAGLLAAYYLHQSGVDCMVVEKGRICSGNTGRTTAKITAQHGLVYQKIAAAHGLDAARRYYTANTEAIAEYERLSREIPCDFTREDNFVYSRGNRQKLEREMSVLQRIGARAYFCDSVTLPLRTVGAVCFPDQAQFHPLKFLTGIASGLNIRENTFVREMVGCTAVTDSGRIRADRVICATHYPFINKHGSYFLKLYQSRSYVIALEHAQPVDGMYVDEAEAGLSFRNWDDLLLLGGGGGRTGKNHESWDFLRQFAREHYPAAREVSSWAAQDCISLDGMPYAGHYSARTPNFYVSTGFNKWGMTSAMVSAWILRDAVLGRENPCAQLLSPSRSILHRQLWCNSAESVAGLVKPRARRCPHMGCALVWNAAERSWDCPCHGSRFDENGKLLDNPANGDLA